jgi:hypothetical protein
MTARSPGPLITVRAAVVLLSAGVVGIIAGSLSYLADADAATALLVAGGAVGAALALFHNLLGR